ncbi:MAG: hypothetical protein GY909_10165 [Oligoflexia bacterium]|nr:hypothetical protein [Oligoflexia bacterium]
MNVKVEVSLGELVDKITILEIKTEKIEDQNKVALAQNEKDVLEQTLKELEGNVYDEVSDLRSSLKDVNLALWKIEDDIREKERQKSFDDEFIDLARRVYITNDQRFKFKNEINTKFGSNIKEVKSYKEY